MSLSLYVATVVSRSLLIRLTQLHRRLLCKGFIAEAKRVRELCAHYVPEDKPGAPSFWRRNYDYGEGLYHGDMSSKKSVEDFLDKHKGKGPNWPKNKKRRSHA